VLITRNGQLARTVEQGLQAEGFAAFVVADPEAANAVVRREENVTFVMMDVEDDMTLPAAVECLRAAGRAMYWSRLPGLVLLSPGLAEQESALRESGVMSPCIAKPIDMGKVLLQIRRSHAR
jgi:DNA-binding response OmpR family regulator